MKKEEKFARFWSLYPRKVARVSAQRSWKRLKVKDINALFKVFYDHLLRWKYTEIQFVPHASTWLNQRRWEDELEPLPGKKDSVYRNIEKDRKKFLNKLKQAEQTMASDEERKKALGFKNNK